MNRADYLTAIASMVRDQGSVLSGADSERALDVALRRLDRDCARTAVEDVVWANTGYFGPLPAAWQVGQSDLLEAEYPVGQSPKLALPLGVSFAPPATWNLMSDRAMAAGTVVRVSYTLAHALADGSPGINTVPDGLAYGVQAFAAHVLCLQIAAHYGSDRESAIAADMSNTDSRSRAFAARSRDYRAAYFDAVGKPDPQQKASSGSNGFGAGSLTAASAFGEL